MRVEKETGSQGSPGTLATSSGGSGSDISLETEEIFRLDDIESCLCSAKKGENRQNYTRYKNKTNEDKIMKLQASFSAIPLLK